MARDPMLARPLPKSIQDRRRKPEPPDKKEPASSWPGIISGAAILGIFAGLIIFGIYKNMPENTAKPDNPENRKKRVAALLEKSEHWYEDESYLDPEAGMNKDKNLSKRAKKLIDEAYERGAKAGHFRQKTAMMTINMRVILEPTAKPGEKPSGTGTTGKETAGKDKEVSAEPETSSMGSKPKRPRPDVTDRRGRKIPGAGPSVFGPTGELEGE